MSSRKDVLAAAEALNARDRSVAVGVSSQGGGGTIKAGIVYEDLKKMVNVSESNGEVSCSVDDTNKLRALLGLKPLRVAGAASAAAGDGGEGGEGEGGSMLGGVAAETVAVANFKAKEALAARARELAEIHVRLERAKKKRLLKEKLAGPTLGDATGGNGNGGGGNGGGGGGRRAVRRSGCSSRGRQRCSGKPQRPPKPSSWPPNAKPNSTSRTAAVTRPLTWRA